MIANPPRCATRNVTMDIGPPSDEIHAYFITAVYVSASFAYQIFYKGVFSSTDNNFVVKERQRERKREVVYVSILGHFSEIRL